MMTERLNRETLSGCTSPGVPRSAWAVVMSEYECEWTFFGFSFLLCGYSLERGDCHLLVAIKPWYKKNHNAKVSELKIICISNKKQSQTVKHVYQSWQSNIGVTTLGVVGVRTPTTFKPWGSDPHNFWNRMKRLFLHYLDMNWWGNKYYKFLLPDYNEY